MQLADCDVEDDPVIYKGTLIYPEWSSGWKGVSKGKGGRFYARITGLKLHGHVSVPGMYETAEEAALERALFKLKLERKELTMPIPKPGRVPRGTGTPLPHVHDCPARVYHTTRCAPLCDRENRQAQARSKACEERRKRGAGPCEGLTDARPHHRVCITCSARQIASRVSGITAYAPDSSCMV